MSQDQKLNFSQFFLLEFFNRICEISQSKLSDDQYNTIEFLISNLKTEEEFAQGIEMLAREHETSELSIFLFDIMDRIMDYPPTLVYDSLQEMAEDFVNTLDILFEETDTLETIKNINEKLALKTKKVKEPVEEESLTESESLEKGIDYWQFIQKEFFENVSEKLSEDMDKDNLDKLLSFIDIIKKSEITEDMDNVPGSLVTLNNILKKTIVDDKSDDSPAIENHERINNLVPEFIENLKWLENENAELIRLSVEENRIVIPELIEDLDTTEVDEKQPSSIESLLSAYFQSEIDDYIEVFRNGFDNIKNEPTSISAIERLEKKFHSFKEISMIHGYEIIEKFCSKIIQILSDIKTNRFGILPEFFDTADELMDQLNQSEKFKGKTNNSPEALNLNKLLNQLEDSIDKTPQKTVIEKELPEKPKEEKGIAFEETSSMLEVLKEVLTGIQPIIKLQLSENKDANAAKGTFDKILKSAFMINHNAINDFCQQYAERLDQLNSLDDSTFQTASVDISDLLSKIVPKISLDFSDNDWQEEITTYDNKISPEYSMEDISSLLTVLIELEEDNLSDFRSVINKIALDQNIEEKVQQRNHFFRLTENLKLLEQSKLIAFSEYYMNLFDTESSFIFPEEILNEIDQSYKLFIETIKNNGKDANCDDICSVLTELISEHQKSEIDVIKEETVEELQDDSSTEIIEEETAEVLKDDDGGSEIIEEVEPAEDVAEPEAEEDLDQIFKDEAKNFIWKIEDSLALYDENEPNYELFGEIEKNIHSLKSSARLMGFDDIANISSKIEDIAENFHSSKAPIEVNDIDIVKESIAGIKAYVDNEIDSFTEIESKLIALSDRLTQQQPEEVTIEEEDTEIKVEDDEKPLFASDEDDEMLEIFKDESSTYIDIIEKTIQALQEGNKDPEEIHQFEYASHSLKSAAKMLGFREIGQISDGLEQLAEALNKNEIVHDTEIHKTLVNSINYIKSLSDGKKLSSSEIADVLNQLEIRKILDRQKESVDFEELQAESSEKVELDPMIDLFLKEAWELLEKINRDLIDLEKKHDNDIIKNLNRNVHTLKGSAQMMQFEKISNISHCIEDFFEKHQNDKEPISDDVMNHIFEAFDEIQEMMKSIKNGNGEVSSIYEQILANLGIEAPEEPEPEIEPKEEIKEEIKTEEQPKVITQEPAELPDDDTQQLVKISTDRLDNLINMAAELVINKTQLLNYIGSLKKLGIDLDKDRNTLKNANYSLEDIIYKGKLDSADSEDYDEISEFADSKYGNLSLISKDFKQTLNTIDLVTSQFNTITQGFEQNINRIAHLTKMLHDDILQVRMLPTENLFNRFPRVVRDLAHQQKKKVELLIEGETTEMDRAMIESLTNPIMHLVRNAIDHGIEIPKERKKQGKEQSGTVLLKAHQDKNQIIIEVQDDGRGIDIEAVKNKIVENGLADKAKVDKMSQIEALDYIFSPGFTTKDETTAVSGRGIGLDVVAEQVQQLKGDIRVNSTSGKGTVFSIRVPLTLIISQAMLFNLGDQVLAVPLISVEETIQFDVNSITVKDNKKYIDFRDDSIPVFELNEILNFPAQEAQAEVQAILIQETGVRYALIVDKVIRREEIVIKSLGAHLQNLEYIAGGTILGDGTIALIIDTTAIVRKVEKEYLERSEGISTIPKVKKRPKAKVEQKVKVETKVEEIQEKEEKKKSRKEKKKAEDLADKRKISGRKPTALIVDDSISVRRFVASVLEKNNYSTVLASDGIGALTFLEKTKFDIVVTDLEMPKMHGFELIEKIRSQEKFKDLPIVILTGRAGKKHKEMGAELGANAFIVKPFKETDLLKTLKKFIES